MDEMPERIWACMSDTAFPYSPKGYWIVNNHDSEDTEYIRADLAAERIAELEARERELEKALTLMIVHGKADLLDETDFEFAEEILDKIDKEPNNES